MKDHVLCGISGLTMKCPCRRMRQGHEPSEAELAEGIERSQASNVAQYITDFLIG